jgi:hypothetical protein
VKGFFTPAELCKISAYDAREFSQGWGESYCGSDLGEVTQELDRLEKSLEDKEIAPEVRRFVRSQIDTIRKAIWEYQFSGAEVFHNAILQTFRDYANSEVAEKYENDPTIREVSSLWERILKFSNAADKVQRGLTALYKMWG